MIQVRGGPRRRRAPMVVPPAEGCPPALAAEGGRPAAAAGLLLRRSRRGNASPPLRAAEQHFLFCLPRARLQSSAMDDDGNVKREWHLDELPAVSGHGGHNPERILMRTMRVSVSGPGGGDRGEGPSPPGRGGGGRGGRGGANCGAQQAGGAGQGRARISARIGGRQFCDSKPCGPCRPAAFSMRAVRRFCFFPT